MKYDKTYDRTAKKEVERYLKHVQDTMTVEEMRAELKEQGVKLWPWDKDKYVLSYKIARLKYGKFVDLVI